MDFYAVYKNGSYIKIVIAEVKNLQADENDTVLHMRDGKQHRVSNHSLGFYETHPFFNKIFIRINRSLMERIADIVQFGVDSYVVMNDNRKIDTTSRWVRHIAARHGVGSEFDKQLKPKKGQLKSPNTPFNKTLLCHPCLFGKFTQVSFLKT